MYSNLKSEPSFYRTPKEGTKGKTASKARLDTDSSWTISKHDYGKDLESKVRTLIAENENLNYLIEQLSNDLERERSQPPESYDRTLEMKIELLAKENERLNNLVIAAANNGIFSLM